MIYPSIRLIALLALCAAFAGCATAPQPFDYSHFKQSAPKSILVLPPISDSPDVNASNAVLSTATAPLAEAGYYVPPASLVVETFRENGLSVANDIHNVSPPKLKEIFGTDAAAYIRITQYGTSYAVISSETRVTIEGKLIDLNSGKEIWAGKATASSKESEGASQGGIAGLLIKALVEQVVGTLADLGYDYSRIANARLFNSKAVNGILPGPRSTDGGKKPAN